MMAHRSFPDPRPIDDEPPGAAVDQPARGRGSTLAHRPDLELGRAVVRPSLRTVEGPGGTVVAEPRVLQVLLHLIDAQGAVVSRDELMAACWGGMIVGDDSVNRALSEIRKIARTVDGGFGVLTVPRVGYRLIEQVEKGQRRIDEASKETARVPSRRLLIGSALAAAAFGGIGFVSTGERSHPRAAALLLRGEQVLRDELPDSAEEAIGHFREAIAIDPQNPEGWGLLALAYRTAAETAPPAGVSAAVRSCEATARQALALDAREPNARAALAALRPIYGDWFAAEERLRSVLAASPDHAWTLSALGVLMESVGRSSESARLVARAADLEPLSPVHQYRLAYKHHLLGRGTEADQVIDRAVQLWPDHPGVLLARLLIFVYTGRYPPALAMLDDADGRRTIMPERVADLWRSAIGALASRRPDDIAAARDAQVEAAVQGPGFAVIAIQMLAMLGDIDAAFAVADGYLLRKGPLVGTLQAAAGQMPVHDQRWRKTMMLFNPATAAMRADPRFAGLVEAIGLVNYWRQRRVQPDYLQAG